MMDMDIGKRRFSFKICLGTVYFVVRGKFNIIINDQIKQQNIKYRNVTYIFISLYSRMK